MPTGGVDATPESIQSWFKAGVCAVGMGSKLISKSLMEQKNYAGITDLTAEVLNMVNTASVTFTSEPLPPIDVTTDKTAIAKEVGLELSRRAKEQNITDNLAFDRGRFLYHGRVKSFADGLREGGLKF